MFAAIAAIAGALLNAYQKKHAANEQRAALNQAQTNQQRYQGQIDAALGDRLSQLAGENPQADQARATADYLGAVKSALAGQGGFGHFSHAYNERAGTDQATRLSDAEHLGKLMGATAGQRDFRRNQGYVNGDLASRIAMLARFAQEQGGRDKLNAETIQPNPWLSLASQGLYSYGMANMAPSFKLPAGSTTPSYMPYVS